MSELVRTTLAPLIYLGAAVLFFFGVKYSTHRGAARAAAPFMLGGFGLAVAGVMVDFGVGALVDALPFIVPGALVGALLGLRIPSAAPPPAFGWMFALSGAASALLAGVVLVGPPVNTPRLIAAIWAMVMGLGAVPIGVALTLWARPARRADARLALAAALAGSSSALLGVAYSNLLLIIAGGVACAGGIALLRSVGEAAGERPLGLMAPSEIEEEPYTNVCDVEEAASVLSSASRVVLVPGCGMAAAQAQHALHEMAQLLEKQGGRVSWLVHPSAGVVPGHMNIVLDEANVPHDKLVELTDAAEQIGKADVVLVVGASDTVNPAAANDPKSPLWGMPVPDLSRVPQVLAIKRSLGPGQSGEPNRLFEGDNCALCFGDAKRVAQAIVAELKRHT